MKIIRTLAVLLAAGGLLAACGSGSDKRTARLEAEVAALKSQVTSTTTTELTPTSSSATTTSTTVPPTTTTTRLVTTTTTRPAPTTTTTIAPWCSVRALASPVTRGMTQTIYATSNLPGRVAVMMNHPVTMDPSGSGQYSFAASGGTMLQSGQYYPTTNKVTVTFYTQPWTLEMVVDKPAPPVITSCTTTYLAIGPR